MRRTAVVRMNGGKTISVGSVINVDRHLLALFRYVQVVGVGLLNTWGMRERNMTPKQASIEFLALSRIGKSFLSGLAADLPVRQGH